MNDVTGRVMDYLGYKNKQKTAEWEERLWRQHLEGSPQDFRADADRRRWGELVDRVEQSRQLARKLHGRRMAHAPPYASPLAATGT
jgi:hypothetical protein